MAYKVDVSPRAQIEIIEAIEFYAVRSKEATLNFIIELEKVYEILKHNPFFVLRYKNVRSIPLNKYPFSLFFVIDENLNLVKIKSCFHNKRNPSNRPK